jgi:hypothetical protein
MSKLGQYNELVLKAVSMDPIAVMPATSKPPMNFQFCSDLLSVNIDAAIGTNDTSQSL